MTGQQQMKESNYGETGWSSYQRMKEHAKDLENGNVSSPLVTHAVGAEPKALKCLVTEAVLISSKAPNIININWKTECGLVPRLEVVGGSWQKTDKTNPGNSDQEREHWRREKLREITSGASKESDGRNQKLKTTQKLTTLPQN